jgi:hypothetical protein
VLNIEDGKLKKGREILDIESKLAFGIIPDWKNY